MGKKFLSPFVFKTNGEPKGSRTLMLEQPTEPWQLEHIATFFEPVINSLNGWLIEICSLQNLRNHAHPRLGVLGFGDAPWPTS